MRRLAAALLAAWPVLIPPAGAQAIPEAAEAFEQRQQDLVTLAGHLGTLHRLRQVCYPDESPELFRRRLMTLIPLEVPMGATRVRMIDAFNTQYRDTSREHATCGRQARQDYALAAEAALGVTERLYAPFRSS